MTESTITREVYEGLQRVEFERWDEIIAQDVLINSPAGWYMRGLQTFKNFAKQITDLAYRIDLVDEHLAVDQDGTGRGFITICNNWKHTKDFGGLVPTGREGTAIETLLFTILEGRITRMDVADNTVDLAIYEWQRGWPIPQSVHPEAILVGVDRREPAAARA